MKKKVLSLLILGVFLFCNADSYAQEKRTFWEKIFGKKTEEINAEDPKNSQDSLAVLLNNHLNEEQPKAEIKETPESKEEMANADSVKPLKTPELNIFMDDDIQNWLDSVTTKDPIGFRIQVYLGDLTEARAVRSSLLSQGERATLEYNSSEYYVRMGDFRTYMAAEKRLAELKGMYPGAYVVRDLVKL